MDEAIIVAGIEQFGRNAGATIRRVSDLNVTAGTGALFEATFNEDKYPTYITVESGIGVFVNYATMCGVVPDESYAPTLLQKNHGGVSDTCFYFSVRVHEKQPWLFLETKQWFGDGTTAENVASTLGLWRLLSRQVKEDVLGT